MMSRVWFGGEHERKRMEEKRTRSRCSLCRRVDCSWSPMIVRFVYGMVLGAWNGLGYKSLELGFSGVMKLPISIRLGWSGLGWRKAWGDD